MRRKEIAVILAILVLVFAVFGCLYEMGGLKQYLRAVSLVQKLPLEKQKEARDTLFGSKNNQYGGILAGVSSGLVNGVWVWGKSGLRFFKTDIYSRYSYYSACGDVLSALESRKTSTVTVKRVLDEYALDWLFNVKSGDYVVVVTTLPNTGGTVGNLKEVLAYDWWSFMQTDLKTECKK